MIYNHTNVMTKILIKLFWGLLQVLGLLSPPRHPIDELMIIEIISLIVINYK